MSNRTLARICVSGAIGTAAFGLFVLQWQQNRIRNSQCYKEALDSLYSTANAISYLGKPIGLGYVQPYNESEIVNDSVCGFKVPLNGSKSKGILYYQAILNDKWYLSKVELELDRLPGQKFLLKAQNSNELENAP